MTEVGTESRNKREGRANRGAKPGERRGGRQKGTPNKVTADVRAMVHEALGKAGGVQYLVDQSKANPSAFLTLVGKVIPKEVTGPDGTPLFTGVRFIGVEVD